MENTINQTSNNSSWSITDPQIIGRFYANPNNTFLVSFPRTGSHWVRMIMELYFEQPSLTRVFYFPENRDYLSLHTHDLGLEIIRPNVIYLYRDPIETIYSQLSYHKEDIKDESKIRFWSEIYGAHLDKWLYMEEFTKEKTIIRYDKFKENIDEEFNKICNHFHNSLDTNKLNIAAKQVSKKNVKNKTLHDQQVINLNEQYRKIRKQFQEEKGDFVWNVILKNKDYLRKFFDI